MTVAVRTSRGKVREINEDSVHAAPDLIIVADGMGGHRGGEVASRMAVKSVLAELAKTEAPGAKEIEAAIQYGNARVFGAASKDEALKGMGTTMTLCLVRGNIAHIAHIGDSRAYLMRNGLLTRLTRDHSLVEELVRNGYITQEQAAVHPHRHIITRALGTEGRVRVDLKRIAVQGGDRILLCTDGVMVHIADAEIESILQATEGLEAQVDALLHTALDRGGEDNISITLARIEGGESL